MSPLPRIRPPLPVFISVLFLFAVLLALAPVMAEQAPGRPSMDERVTRMTDTLELDVSQQSAFRKVMLDFGTSMHRVMNKHGIDPGSGSRPPLHKMFAVRSEMAGLQTRMENRMASFLSQRQMRRFRSLHKQQRAAWRARRKP